ncbi:MAG: hypothetical protein RIG61_12495 [Deltaproteobacteria bacterium]
MKSLLKHILVLIILFSGFLWVMPESRAEFCGRWSAGEKTGSLDYTMIDEASGIAASSIFPGRLYHINDSGGGPYFFTTDVRGKNAGKIRINGFDARSSDFEDVDVGECLSSKSCLFIADIGDNGRKRKFTEILVIQELENYNGSVTPVKRLKVVYPDGPRNAEGMALHPNGDIYILTKEEDLDRSEAYPARLYRLEKARWESAGEGPLKLDYVGDIDFTVLGSSDSVYGKIVSSFDIAPDGKSFLVLTYENAYEFNIDLSESALKPAGEMKKGIDYSVIELDSLLQQESITYVNGGKEFLYDTEYHLFGAPIMKVRCLNGQK